MHPNAKYPTTWARIMALSRFDPETGCWPWKAQIHKGYAQMNMRVNGKHSKIRVIRWVAEQVLGRPLDPVLETIEHLCANTECICPHCMGLMTSADNAESARNRQLGRPCTLPITLLVPPGAPRYWHIDEPIPF